MGAGVSVSRVIEAPLEQVGGALERAIDATSGWTLGAVERELGDITATLKVGLGLTADTVQLRLTPAAAGQTGTQVEASLALGSLSRRGARERALVALLEGVAGEVSRSA